jgi:ATP/ADP translocase
VSDVRARIGGPRVSHHRDPKLLREGETRGSEVAALATALTLTSAAAEITLASRLGLFFDVCFVVICLVAALMVRPRDFFTVGVLPPLLMLGTMVLVALNGAEVIAARHDSALQAVITGLAHHSVALFVGYGVCLVTLVLRQRAAR